MTTRARSILRAISHKTVYFSMPSYTVNWNRKFGFAKKFLQVNPLVVVDIGSRDGSCDELENLVEYSEYVGFDADSESVDSDSLSPSLKKWRKANIYNFFIGTRNAKEDFNLYVRKSESSLLNPSKNYQKNFSSRLRVESQVTVESVILSDALLQLNIKPDLIKLDTQGTEYDVIESSKEVFSNCLMVEVEAEFLEMYENQKLFPEVSKILYEKGFQLLYINRVFGNMNNEIVKTRGQLIFADMLFGLNFENAANLSFERKYKYVLLLMNYGHNDFAFQIYNTDENFQELCPELKFEFDKLKQTFMHRLRLAFITQLDKLAFAYLAVRRTNGLHFDSDRSWPIR